MADTRLTSYEQFSKYFNVIGFNEVLVSNFNFKLKL